MGKEITIRDKQERNPESELEFKQYLTRIHHELKSEVGPDFVFTSLEGKNQEFVIEAIHNAQYGVMIYKRIEENTTKWEWRTDKWIRRTLNEQEKNQISEMAKQLYKIQTIRPHMTVTFNLNKSDNSLIKWLLNIKEENEEENNMTAKEKGMFEKIMNKLRGEE